MRGAHSDAPYMCGASPRTMRSVATANAVRLDFLRDCRARGASRPSACDSVRRASPAARLGSSWRDLEDVRRPVVSERIDREVDASIAREDFPREGVIVVSRELFDGARGNGQAVYGVARRGARVCAVVKIAPVE